MGLSERKVKQKIGLDPRNLSWSDDKSRFSYKHMTALGWNENGGLGAGGDGNPNHIAVIRKSDNGGIGMERARKDGSDMAAGAGQAGRGLEDVLKRIAAASASPSPSPAPEMEVEASTKKEENKVIRNRIASRQKHLNSKRMASHSPAALAEILGVPISSLPSTSSPSPSPSAPSTPQPEASISTSGETSNERTADETVTKSTLSVSDYFRQKMREKMAARQAAANASGGSTDVKIDDLPSSSLEHLSASSSSSKPIGGTAWEGQKMQFGNAEQVEFDPSSGPVDEDQDQEKEKSSKKKKEKKDKKKDKSGTSTPIALEGEDPIHIAAEHVHEFEHAGEIDEKEKKRKEKEEKKRKKEEKKAKKAEIGVEVEKKEKKRKRDDEGEKEVKPKKEKKEKKDKKEKKEKKEKSPSS